MGEARARVELFQGVVSFLDVAGFTKLTERLARQPDGVSQAGRQAGSPLFVRIPFVYHGWHFFSLGI